MFSYGAIGPYVFSDIAPILHSPNSQTRKKSVKTKQTIKDVSLMQNVKIEKQEKNV